TRVIWRFDLMVNAVETTQLHSVGTFVVLWCMARGTRDLELCIVVSCPSVCDEPPLFPPERSRANI
ncbi:hypothetical protein HN011_003307, partial [Eciton burchellii]